MRRRGPGSHGERLGLLEECQGVERSGGDATAHRDTRVGREGARGT